MKTPPSPPQYIRGRTLMVLYGSETGSAQDYAYEVSRSAQRLHFDTRVMAMNDLELSFLPNLPLVIFVTSTTGQGDVPANMSTFWRFLLRKKLPQDFLSNLWFTSFGLGDSTYLKFNWAVKKLHKRVLQLGGREACLRGEGDEQHPEGIDSTFLPWSKVLFEKLLEMWPLPEGIQRISDDIPLPREYILEFDHSETMNKSMMGLPTDIYTQRPNSHLATVYRNERVTSKSHWQDVRHLKFTTTKDITYYPGDVLSLSPQNLARDVSIFLDLQGWNSVADIPLKITPTMYLTSLSTSSSDLPLPPPPIPNPVSPLTLRTLLTHHLDFTAIPRRSFFSHIANYTIDPRHKERLLEFVDPEHVDELWDYTTRPRRTILEVLQEFDSVKLDWQEGLLCGGGLGIIRERLFSIASSQQGMHLTDSYGTPDKPGLCPLNETPLSPNRTVEILAAIVKYQTVLKRPRSGLCTRWLAVLSPGDKVNIIINRNVGGARFSFFRSTSAELERPVVMICPGTGVAPMRSLAWERLSIGIAQGSRIGDMLLFFGCRNREADFFFKAEWERWQHHHENNDSFITEQENGHESLSLCKYGNRKVFVAFSRDQKQKHYVQDLINEHASAVFHALHDQEGTVYVCGSSGRMPQAVREALIEVFERGAPEGEKKMRRDQAERYLVDMERAGRYRQETW